MTDEEYNEKVAYNQTVSSWIIDIIATLIWFPMLIVIIIRRLRYRTPRTVFYEVKSIVDNNSEEDIPIKKIDLTFHNTINSLTNEQRYNLMSILFFIAGFAKNTNMEKIVLQFIDSTAKEMGVIVEDSIQYAMLHNHNADLLVENVKYIMGLYPNVKKVFLKKCYELGKLTNNSEALMFSYTLSEECGVSKEDICK